MTAPTTTVQPYADLGLQPEEYQRICTLLGRLPTDSELAMYAVMWSEHCSYKSSKVHLRRFGDLPRSDVLTIHGFPSLSASLSSNSFIML